MFYCNMLKTGSSLNLMFKTNIKLIIKKLPDYTKNADDRFHPSRPVHFRKLYWNKN